MRDPMDAAQGQVVGYCLALVLARDDVVDLKGSWIEGLRDEAVFAGAAGPVPDQFDERSLHESALAIHFRVDCLSA